MSDLRPIDPAPFSERMPPFKQMAGKRPELRWIAIEYLRVDRSYQRGIHERGIKNLRKIASEFDWALFGIVVVSPIDDTLFAIIDGQHRTFGAALRGIRDVPCEIVEADIAKQAQAFAAINSQVTAVTPMQLYAARLAAGDESAKELAEVCAAAGVTICRYPIPASNMKVGETLAAGQLQNMMRRYGAEVLAAALRCITKTREGNAGLVRAPIVGALCSVLDAEPAFRTDEKDLIGWMQSFDFAAAFETAGKRAFAERSGQAAILVDMIAEHLDRLAGAAK
jgi:hypothetical protein